MIIGNAHHFSPALPLRTALTLLSVILFAQVAPATLLLCLTEAGEFPAMPAALP